jgi:hypothetical protein
MKTFLQKIVLSTILVSIPLSSAVFASEVFTSEVFASEGEEPTPLRIQELIPGSWVEYPAIDPAIPEDFVMRQMDDGMGIVWGSETDLDLMDEDEAKSFSKGIFVLKHSTERQTGPSSFSFKKKELIQEMNKIGYKVVNARITKWGDYPVFNYEGISTTGDILRTLWVGLNSPERKVLSISLISTSNRNRDEKLWNKFVNDTKELTGKDYLLSRGVEMNDGCTTYTCSIAAVEAKVEKRSGDRKLAIMVKPLNDKTTFTVQKTEQSIMAGPWRHADHTTKIYGTLTYEDGNYKNVYSAVIMVFNKSVNDFSFSLDKFDHGNTTVILTN